MLAYHFGWDIEYILALTPIQFSMVMDGLSEILKQKYDPNYKDEAQEEAMRKISEIKATSLIDKKRKGKKLTLQDLS